MSCLAQTDTLFSDGLRRDRARDPARGVGGARGGRRRLGGRFAAAPGCGATRRRLTRRLGAPGPAEGASEQVGRRRARSPAPSPGIHPPPRPVPARAHPPLVPRRADPQLADRVPTLVGRRRRRCARAHWRHASVRAGACRVVRPPEGSGPRRRRIVVRHSPGVAQPRRPDLGEVEVERVGGFGPGLRPNRVAVAALWPRTRWRSSGSAPWPTRSATPSVAGRSAWCRRSGDGRASDPSTCARAVAPTRRPNRREPRHGVAHALASARST